MIDTVDFCVFVCLLLFVASQKRAQFTRAKRKGGRAEEIQKKRREKEKN